MMIIGFPISSDDIFSYTGCTHLTSSFYASSFHNLNLFLNPFGLQYIYVDKSFGVLGIEIKDTSDLWTTFCTVDKVIVRIMETKIKFISSIKKAGFDLTKVTFYYMEGDSVEVEHPEPMCFTFNING